MKKLTALTTAASLYLASASSVFATAVFPQQQANQGVPTSRGVQGVIQNAITIVFAIAVILVLWFLILGAFNWITSGGDKEKIGSARKMIINALIGLAILALAFLIMTVIGGIVGIDPTKTGLTPL